MKKIFIYPLFLLTGAAVASTTFYYDSTGQCSGLFLNPNATSCSQAVTKIVPPTTSQRQTFNGYWAGNTKVIDQNGNILVNGSTAANLFNNTDNTTKKAQGQYNQNGFVTVIENTFWTGYQNNWYVCSGVQFNRCVIGENLVLPYAPNCWSFDTNPQTTGYDYLFVGWRTADGTLHPASSVGTGGWSNPYPSEGAATGDSVIRTGCTDTYLGSGSVSSGTSDHKIYPFACKKFDRGSNYPASQRWVTEIDWPEGHGMLELEPVINGEHSGCTYVLACYEGFHSPINNLIYIGDGCGLASCSSWNFDGTIVSLLDVSSRIRQGCVQDIN